MELNPLPKFEVHGNPQINHNRTFDDAEQAIDYASNVANSHRSAHVYITMTTVIWDSNHKVTKTY